MVKQNKWRWYDGKNSYHKKEIKMRDALIKEAKGHTCNECKHLGYGYCARHESVETGMSIECCFRSPVCFAFFQENCMLKDCE